MYVGHKYMTKMKKINNKEPSVDLSVNNTIVNNDMFSRLNLQPHTSVSRHMGFQIYSHEFTAESHNKVINFC